MNGRTVSQNPRKRGKSHHHRLEADAIHDTDRSHEHVGHAPDGLKKKKGNC